MFICNNVKIFEYNNYNILLRLLHISEISSFDLLYEKSRKKHKKPRRACMRRLMTVDGAKEVCSCMFGTPSCLAGPIEIKSTNFSVIKYYDDAILI